jgi:hypothetical protein
VADGELRAAQKLADASGIMAQTPGALQLRLLQTVVEVAAEKNSTLIMPLPVELLRFFDRAVRTGPDTGPDTGSAVAGAEQVPPEEKPSPALAEAAAPELAPIAPPGQQAEGASAPPAPKRAGA